MNPKKILVIDDECGITRLIKLSLERTGPFVVRDENRATRALAAAREFQPDLVLLDLVMPEMDGAKVAAELRADPQLHHVPILLLTAMDKPETPDEVNAAVAGLPRIAKPINLSGIRRAIEKALAA